MALRALRALATGMIILKVSGKSIMKYSIIIAGDPIDRSMEYDDTNLAIK